MMHVTVKNIIPIGDFRAIEQHETFTADRSFEVEGTSLVYFQKGYQVKTVPKDKIVKIWED